jgi:hypothetical protein
VRGRERRDRPGTRPATISVLRKAPLQKDAKIQAERKQTCMSDCASKPAQGRKRARKNVKVSDISYSGGGKGSDSE